MGLGTHALPLGPLRRAGFGPLTPCSLISPASPSVLPSVNPFTEEDKRKRDTEGGKWAAVFSGISGALGTFQADHL